ncbi:hypothetical protein CHRYSEOSP005_30110 [Chryseobacterium sp. Alg-005]|uniref:hypothetical protein n=1 Tax=Chryseobacterium sp. Alg-005 TaxID=3159516 RepID=UPI0035558086
MKFKTLLIVLLLILIVGSSIKYLDLSVSEKYETQLEGLNPTKEQIKDAQDLKRKIDMNKKIALSIIFLSIVAIYPISRIKNKL